MKIPKKITPDNIKDSLVEFRFKPLVPFEIILGKFFDALDETYRYTSAPYNKKGRKMELQLPVQPSFYNDQIKFEVRPNSIVFNQIDSYLGWETYSKEIEKVISQLLGKSNAISSFTRIGLRFVSEHPNHRLKDVSNFDFSFGIKSSLSDAYQFRSEFQQEDYRIILSLSDHGNLINNDLVDFNSVSVIDVDVIREASEIKELEKLIALMNEVHEKQKYIAFSVFSENYINSLNVEY